MINKLAWDSSFFNVPVYNLNEDDIENIDISHELGYFKKGMIQCKLNIMNSKSLETLIQNNFLIESVGITYKKKIKEFPVIALEFATDKDEAVILKIAHGMFSNTRFKDCYFGLNSAERLYSYWIGAAIRGEHDDCCLVKKDKDGTITGFVTVRNVENYINIGLIAVDVRHQKKGIGQELMQLAEIYALSNNIENIMVTTQYDNIPARKMYKVTGYLEDTIFYWLYLNKNM